MSSPENREAVRRIEESLRGSSQLCRVAERELLHHTDRDDRYWEAGVVAEQGRLYGLLVAAVAGGLLDRLAEEEFLADADREWYDLREDYANSDTGSEATL